MKKKKLYALKHIHNHDCLHLIQRELDNYSKVHHPFLLRTFGNKINQNQNCLILEYVEGFTLDIIKEMNLKMNERIKIIFQMMIILQYLHHNNYIYRDLKPNNLIIDKFGSIVLIDLDRMIENNEIYTGVNSTHDFGSIFIAPEIADGEKYSFSADIYSLGQIINYLISDVQINEYKQLHQMYIECTNKNPFYRPNISDLINKFYTNFFVKLSNGLLEPNLLQLINGIQFSKLTKYLFLISEFNHQYSIFKLALLYHKGKLFKRNDTIASKYILKISESNSNIPEMQLFLVYHI